MNKRFNLQLFISLLGIAISTVLIFTWSKPIRGLEDSYYMIFIHPVFAWTAYISFILSAYFSYKFLKVKKEVFALKLNAVISVGFLFIIFAAFSGMAWGQIAWGGIGVENMDPRFTSIIFVLFMYSGFFVFRSSIRLEEKKNRLSAVYALFSLPFATFFMFVLPRIQFSLHPKNPLFNAKKSGGGFGMENFVILGISLISIMLLAQLIYQIKFRIIKLEGSLEKLYE